jgi:hypothetical protein
MHKLRDGVSKGGPAIEAVYCDVRMGDPDRRNGSHLNRGECSSERTELWSETTCPDCKQDCRELFPSHPQPEPEKEPEKGVYVFLDDKMCRVLRVVCDLISGDPKGPRGETDKLSYLLRGAGYTFDDKLQNSGTIYLRDTW